MFDRLRSRMLLPFAVVAAVAVGAIVAVPAGAAKPKSVKCIGNAYFCGTAISIAGGVSNRVVTVQLTDTNFKRVAVRVTPKSSKGAFSITKASFRSGGSEYRFTLNAVRSNPRNAKIILLFSAGVKS